MLLLLFLLIIPGAKPFIGARTTIGVVNRHLLESLESGDSIGVEEQASALLVPDIEKVPKRIRYVKGIANLETYRDAYVDCKSMACPTFEMTRLEAISKLRKRMHALIRKEGCDSRRGWVRAFERFHFHSGLMKDFRYHTADGKPVDPFLPSGTSEMAQTLLRRDLEQLEGMPKEGAARVAAMICEDAQRMTKVLVARFRKQTREGVPQDSAQQEVQVIRNKNNDHISLRLASSGVEAAYQQQDFRVHQISGAHSAKLRLLWDDQCRRNGNVNDDASFYRAVFCLLTRMHALEGKGYQAGSPTRVYEELRRSFGVTAEMFASPLNCYFPHYFSAFPDTDSAFGSCGSFYNLDEQWAVDAGGSFVGNPPFVQLGILHAAKITHDLIARADAAAKQQDKEAPPLSFILIVPAWGASADHTESPHPRTFYDSDGPSPYEYIVGEAAGADLHMAVLLAHPNARASMTLGAQEHCYVDGHQHHFTPPAEALMGDGESQVEEEVEEEVEGGAASRVSAAGVRRKKVTWQDVSRGGGGGGPGRGRGSRDYYRAVAFDSAVVVIQNDAGARKWPFTKQKENRLRRAWAGLSSAHTGSRAAPVPAYVPKARRAAAATGE